VVLTGNQIAVSWVEGGQPRRRSTRSWRSWQPANQVILAYLPFACLHHDDINPRSIVDLEPMIEEFYAGYPQLQPSLATLTFDATREGASTGFDGQHKAAAQLYARRDRLFVRVFVNYNRERLKETNYRATPNSPGAFPAVDQRSRRGRLFKEEFSRFVQCADPKKVSEDCSLASTCHGRREANSELLRQLSRYES